jgi:hypothetical protein
MSREEAGGNSGLLHKETRMSREDDFFGDFNESPDDVETGQDDTSEPLMDEHPAEEHQPPLQEPARPAAPRAKPKAKKKAKTAKKKVSKTARKPAAKKTAKKTAKKKAKKTGRAKPKK